MNIFPAIDLMDGRCVRLSLGRFDEKSEYSSDPTAVAQDFERQGATYLHIVDLDGAKAGRLSQLAVIDQILGGSGLRAQVGGGIRSREDIQGVLDAGAERVIIGSLAFKEPVLFGDLVEEFGPERFTMALDFSLDDAGRAVILSSGWQEQSGSLLETALEKFLALKLKRFLCTDISKDGLLKGPNQAFYARLQNNYPTIELLASGGVSNLEDLRQLKTLGIFGCIVGKALYEKRFQLKEALTC